jgi:hypothetical protein
LKISLFPNPAGEFIAVQVGGLLREKAVLRLFDFSGKMVQTTEIQAGSTIGYFDVRAVYPGAYWVKVEVGGREIGSAKVVVAG